jgi:hypothetical protein
MDPMQFLDDKTKEKSLVEEMKNKYDVDRGMRGIIIKRINDVAIQMATKILACKLLRKFHREEVPTGVVTVVAQCVEGTTVSWELYLLNLFLDDCKDAHDLGTKFHYSCILMLIAIMGWKEPNHTLFTTRPKPNYGVRYLSLGAMSDDKNRNMNAAVFKGYLCDLQEAISNLWRITPQAVAHYWDITNFKATQHAMWVQVPKDPNKKWLQLRYFITEGGIKMVIRYWEDEWKI